MTNTSISFLEKYLGFLFCAFISAVRWVLRPFSKRGNASSRSQKIVFVKFIEQGAFVLHQTSFKEAATQYRAENIFLCTFLSNKPLIEILNIVPHTNVIYINEKTFFHFTAGFASAILQIRKKRIDTAIDLEFLSAATAIFCYLTGASKRAGYHRYMGSQNYRGDLFTHRLSYSHYVHVAESSWCLLKSIELLPDSLPALDISLSKSYNSEVVFVPDSADQLRIKQMMGASDKIANNIIVINPSLNDVLPLRKWPAAYYRDFIGLFINRYPDYKFVFTGREDEREMTDTFIASAGLSDAVNLCGKTSLRDILTLYTYSKLLLTSDSGPGHFATLTPVSAVVLFGPETPVLYSPLSDRTKVLYRNLPCSPCYNVYNNRQSPCSNNICMSQITVKEVMGAVEQILK
jgi:ADP-heptose:LPS heptosyltransferase